jgi:thioredoxin-like negative regulator of GroEL
MIQPARLAAAAVLLLLLSPPARALPKERDSWIRLDTDHFVVFSNAGERVARRTASNLERLRDVLSQIAAGTQLGSPQPMYIYLFGSRLSFVPYRPAANGKPMDVDGYFYSREDAEYMVLRADAGEATDNILYHEYLHYVLRNNFANLPVWFNEGMAELYATFQATDEHADIGRPSANHIRWLRENSLIPLAQLFAMDRNSKDYNEGYRRGVFYAESWALIHYLTLGNEARSAQTNRFFHEMTQGVPAPEAFRRAFNTDEAILEKELRDYAHRSLFNYKRVPVKPESKIEARVAPLSWPETLTRLGDLLMLGDASQLPEADRHYRQALAAQPGFGPALGGLCRIESAQNRPALDCFTKAAQAAPDNFTIQYEYARALLTQPQVDSSTALQARNALARAVELQPNHGQAWVRLAYALTWKEMLDPGDLPAFETAHRLAPNDPSGTLNLILAYARLGQRDRAAELVEKEVIPRGNPEEIGRAWQTWVNASGQQAGTLLEHGKLAEAVPILQELARRAPAEHTVQVREQLAEVERALAYNAFVQRYNEAVDVVNAGKLEEGRALLQELAANAPTPEQAESVRKLIEEIDGILKTRKSVKRKP